MDLPALMFRCEHVNVIAGEVVVFTAKQPILWGCCYARSGTESVAARVYVSFPRGHKYLLINYDITVLFLLVQIHSLTYRQYAYARIASHHLAGTVAERSHHIPTSSRYHW